MNQGEYHYWNIRGEDDALGFAYRCRYILLLLWPNRWLEICNLSLWCTHSTRVVYCIVFQLHAPQNILLSHVQESAHENSQKYKEGKFVLERYDLPLIFFRSMHNVLSCHSYFTFIVQRKDRRRSRFFRRVLC